MSWFHHRADGKPRRSGADDARHGRPVIRQVPGIKVDLLVTLPDGGKSRSAHYARLESDALGRTRIGNRNLVLHLGQAPEGALVVTGDVAADGELPAFAGAAPDGATSEWPVPVAGGIATVRLTVHREDVPA